MPPLWHEEAIAKHHDRATFDCGDKALNDFLHLHARKNHVKGGSKTYLAIDDQNDKILGYYSLSPASIAYSNTPPIVTRNLSGHDLPVFRLARLAIIDSSIQNQGLGGKLLLSAGERCLRVATQVGGVALLINAKNQRASQWYARYGAVPLLDNPLSLVLPFSTIHNALLSHTPNVEDLPA